MKSIFFSLLVSSLLPVFGHSSELVKLNQRISNLEKQIEQAKTDDSIFILRESSISKLTDKLSDYGIKLQISSEAAEMLLKTKTAGIIETCLNGYLANLPARSPIQTVNIRYVKADNDFSEGYAANKQLDINVKYWDMSSNLASINPKLKAIECFDIVYTKFIK